jgi:hypothetical protein
MDYMSELMAHDSDELSHTGLCGMCLQSIQIKDPSAIHYPFDEPSNVLGFIVSSQ